jgi:hypothetical protein
MIGSAPSNQIVIDHPTVAIALGLSHLQPPIR